MEIEFDTKTTYVEYQCDKCKIGNMVRSGNIMLMTDPPQYPHKCDNCGNMENSNISYPYTKSTKVLKNS